MLLAWPPTTTATSRPPGGGRAGRIASPLVGLGEERAGRRGLTVEVDGETHRGRARVVEAVDEGERARSLVFSKYQPRYDGDLTDWRERSLPVAISLFPAE